MTNYIMLALRESITSLQDFDRWAMLAWTDTSLRYRRTVLGPWWVTLSTGAIIGSVGLVFGAVFGSEMSTYMPFFATGFILWAFISGSLTEGCNVFTQAGGLIKSTPTPLMIHVYRMMGRQLIVLAHNAALISLLWLVFQWPVDWSFLLVVPGLAIVTVALTGAVLTLGVLCTRFRDIQQVIGAVLQLLFLLTPIIWMPSILRGKATSYLMDFNPLYYLIEVVRGPILGHSPHFLAWLVAVGSAVLSLSVGYAVYGRFSHRVAYWL